MKFNRIEWRPGFSVGIENIDNQHKSLIRALNDVAASLEKGDADECVLVYDEFLRLSAEHFASEERILFSSGYPHAQEHADHHLRLLKMAEEAQAQCKSLVLNRQTTECFNALLEFLIGDLLEADIKFKSFLEELDKDRLRQFVTH
ncbi:MAG: hypothetical protein EPN26_02585 [Rhodospirillales bacterium]|nr:MAG: hypothetical protein EPN26_02585 [Rhodospirillales bacterium]